MIETISGLVNKVLARSIVVSVAGIGFAVQVANPLKFIKDEAVNLLIFWVWNAEKGPILFGFQTELERSVFAMLLECPKIGPQISLQILAQESAAKILQILALGDEHALATFSGIGPKKAKSMVGELQDKAAKLLTEQGSALPEAAQGSTIILDEVCGALKSMGYSTVEISAAMSGLDSKTLHQGQDFAGLTRLLLSRLLQQKSV